eukprot:m.132813 g.132813  ORF g.132813 m.132813 type:complete len:788 (-) comp29632_c0_seq3:90-2453(-)
MSTKPKAMKPQPPKSTSVKVVVRCRPLNSKEVSNNCEKCVDIDPHAGSIKVTKPESSSEPKKYTFDHIYDANCKQADIYDESVHPIVEDVIRGFNGTVFAYGQTGTGKTWTMEGDRKNPEQRGVIPRAFQHIFDQIGKAKEGQQYLVRASYLEIYAEEIRDLLSKNHEQKLDLREKDNSIYVKDLSSFVTKSIKEIQHVMSVGNKHRSVGQTDMNAHSSRSHAIFIVTVECCEEGPDGESHIRVGKLNLVDLAGSERQRKTNATGQRLHEGTKINLSLSCLGNVIKALVEGGRKHVPYRDSILTRLLQDSLGGNAKTAMIANIGPADYNYDETCTTLRYANGAKSIKNQAKINEDPKDALLREFQEKITLLKEQLQKKKGGGKSGKKKKKKKQRLDANGVPVPRDDDDDEEEEDDDDGDNEEAIFEEEQKKLEAARQSTMANKSLTEQEKAEIQAEIANKSEQLKEERRQKAKIVKQIEAMESKLLGPGGKHIAEVTKEQELELRKKHDEIDAAKEKSDRMERKLQEKERLRKESERAHAKKETDLEDKTKKLNKLFAKFKQAKQEIEELQQGIAQEREGLSQDLNVLQRDLKLSQLIIEHFVPPDVIKKLEARATFDEANECWQLKPIGNDETNDKPNDDDVDESSVMIPRPQCATATGRHAICADARMRAQVDQNFRYRPENIFLVELDMPDRTTQEYMAPIVDPHVAEALEDALKDEDDMTLDADPDDFLAKAVSKAKRDQKRQRNRSNGKERTKSKSKAPKQEIDRATFIPEARGLVKKHDVF